MTNKFKRQILRAPVQRRPSYWMGVALSVALAMGTASASIPVSNDLGFHFKVLRTGPTASVEIRVTPRRDFDSVSVEAASGVASLAPSCGFTTLPVLAGGSYVCRVNVTGKPAEAAMTVNVIGRRAVPGSAVPVTEIHHLSVKNPAFALSQRRAASSHHDVADSAATPK